MLPLPGVSTLKKYVQDFQIKEGYLDNVAHFLSLKVKDWTEEERLVSVMFDEVHLTRSVDYDEATDSIVGPHSSANVLLVRGLIKNFKMPVWFNFGFGLTPEVLRSIITKLAKAGLHVVVIACDMGPCNRGLATGLGVTKDQPFFPHPDRPDQPIFWVFDVPHLLKLCRKHFLESGFILKSGTRITKTMLMAIHSATRKNDIVAGHHLTDAHLHVRHQDQQSVKKAAQLLSWRTASLVKLLGPIVAPGNKAMDELGSFIGLVDNWFDCCNSQKKYDRKKMRSGLRVYHDQQVACMEEMHSEIDGLTVVGKRSHMLWQTGILTSTKALLLLYDSLTKNYNLSYLLTRRVNQDPLEHSFSILRAMGGMNTNPSALNFQRRLRRFILGGMNNVIIDKSLVSLGEDEETTVLTLQDLLQGFAQLEKDATTVSTAENNRSNNNNNNTSIPSNNVSSFSKNTNSNNSSNGTKKSVASNLAIEEGFNYVCGYLLRKVDWPEKACKKDLEHAEGIVESKWIDSLNTGGLSYPAMSVVEDVRKMDAAFEKFHKESGDGLKRGHDVTKMFANDLSFQFPGYPRKFLEKFAFARTMWRLRQMRLDLKGCKESARSKKKSIDFGY